MEVLQLFGEYKDKSLMLTVPREAVSSKLTAIQLTRCFSVSKLRISGCIRNNFKKIQAKKYDTTGKNILSTEVLNNFT